MRIELHVFLWVTAVILTWGAISYGSVQIDFLPYTDGLGERGVFPAVEGGTELSPIATSAPPEIRPTRLFAQNIMPILSAVEAPMQPVERLVLKGIVQTGGQAKGLLTSDAGAFQVVGVGETFLDATVISVSADRVSVVRNGSEETLVLRGTGELP